jgi:putative RecB family exonuclease
MPLPLPRSLSPSKVSSFRSCPLAFKFSVIDRIPEPASPAMVKGTLVHAALEKLFWDHDQGQRSPTAALHALDQAWEEMKAEEEFQSLGLTEPEQTAFFEDAAVLVNRYFEMENPDSATVLGVELLLEADLDGMLLRGIIDRLDVDESGELVVVDYKTGRAPSETQENSRLGGLHTYALLCERVLGRRPASVKLLYLRDRLTIEASPSEQSSRGTGIRTAAVWTAITRACEMDDFRPSPSGLCRSCSFREFCPAVGGDLSLAVSHARRVEPAPATGESMDLHGEEAFSEHLLVPAAQSS